jgi:hypothetical protein
MMSQPELKNEGSQAAESKLTVKKPHPKLEMRHEPVFETLALMCGKVQTTQFSCFHNRRTS